jgi:hypothetical protein
LNRFVVACAIICSCAAAVSIAADEDVSSRVVRIDRSELQLRFDTDFSAEHVTALTDWVGRRGKIVADFYGQFPVQKVVMNLQAVDGGRVRGGTTYPRSPPIIRLRVGREVAVEELNRDWVLVHEMIHLALPYVGDEHSWLSEGLATYVESIARVRTGDIEREQLWGDFVKAMPQGLPKSGDQGLDNTHTWGRTYWGGAIFNLLADVEIRKRSNSKFGLRDALQAVLKESGGFTADWSPDRIFQVGDAAIKQNTLSELYARHKDAAVAVDLDALWKQLGVNYDGSKVTFDEQAPLAAIRRAIESR